MHVWRSTARTPRSFSAHFLGGVGGMCNTFSFPLPATKCQPSQNPKQQTYRVTDLSHGSTSLRRGFSLSSGFGKSWLSPPVLDCGYAKYAPQCCAHNMWQETSQTDADVLMRLWRAVGCPSFRRTRLTPKIVLIRRFVCARRYVDLSIWGIVSVGCLIFPQIKYLTYKLITLQGQNDRSFSNWLLYKRYKTNAIK